MTVIKTVFIDTETTGTDQNKHGLIQFSGTIDFITDTGFVEKDKFDFRLNTFPNDVIEDQALLVNNITREQIKSYPDPRKVYCDFVALLSKYCDKYDKSDKMFFAGYNARFDYDFMRKFFEKNGDKYFGSFFFFPPVDIMNIAIFNLIKQRTILPNFKLKTVVEHLGISIDGALHDANTDIIITKQIFKKYFSEVYDERF